MLHTSRLIAKTIVEQTPSKYGPYILATIPIVAGCLGWFLIRMIKKYDKAQEDRVAALDKASEDRLASLVRHQNSTNDTVTALTKLHHESQRELTERLTSSFEELVAANNTSAQRLAYIEGKLGLGPG